MRPGDRAQFDDGPVRRSAGESRRDALGPQGAALILELERLRHAFEHETPNDAPTPQARRSARGRLTSAIRPGVSGRASRSDS